MKQNNDLSLVSQVAEFHDRTAFDRLVVKYQSSIRRFFLHQTLGDVQLSDDLAQDTFVKAYVNISKFRGQAAFSTWLYRIACNVLYDCVLLTTSTPLMPYAPIRSIPTTICGSTCMMR